MRADLPSGGWIEFRDKMMRADIVEARRGMKFVTAPDGSRMVDGAFLDEIRGRIMTHMMIDWSFGYPLPRDCTSTVLAEQRLSNVLDDADSLAADMVVQPWCDRIVRDPATSRFQFTEPVTGIVLSAASDEDLQRLLATGKFTVPDSPKAVPSSSGTVSAALPGPSGPAPTTVQTP